MAYEFQSAQPDSLRGMWINFPKVLVENAEDFDLELLVWEDTASEPIYTSEIPINPIYSGANGFSRYDFEDPIFIQSKFYIGFRQLQSDKVYVGFDKNTNSQSRILYRTGDKWFQSSFEGSLLLRPDFGANPFLGVNEQRSEANLDIRIYPNPTSGFVSIDPQGNEIDLSIYSLNGQVLLTDYVKSLSEYDLTRYSPGIYFLHILDSSTGETNTRKLIITD